MGNKLRRRPDIDGAVFLGSDDKKYGSYLKHFFETDIEGDCDQKFEAF
jgi:hypothetical protein